MKLKIHETINNQTITLQLHTRMSPPCHSLKSLYLSYNSSKLTLYCQLLLYRCAVKLPLSLYTCVDMHGTARVCWHKSPEHCPGPGCSVQQLGPAAHPGRTLPTLPLVRFLAPSNSAKLHGLHDREILDKGRIDMTPSTSRLSSDTGTLATSYKYHHITNTEKIKS